MPTDPQAEARRLADEFEGEHACALGPRCQCGDPTCRPKPENECHRCYVEKRLAPLLAERDRLREERDAWAERCRVDEQDLAIAGVRGSPPPGGQEATIPRLKRERDAALKRAGEAEQRLKEAFAGWTASGDAEQAWKLKAASLEARLAEEREIMANLAALLRKAQADVGPGPSYTVERARAWLDKTP